MKPTRKHYGRVCGIIPLVLDKREVTLNVTKTTGKEVVSRNPGNVPEVTVNHSDLSSSSSASIISIHTNQLFSKLPPLQKIHLVQLSVHYVH